MSRLAPVNFHNARICAKLRILCPVCGEESGMDYDFPDVRIRKLHGIGLLRETLCCKSCGATMRDRQMALGLLDAVESVSRQHRNTLRELRDDPVVSVRILDTDSFSPLNQILRGMPGYSHSQYKSELGGVSRLPDGSLNVDLLSMPFEDGSFDIIMTSDVMEHVAEDDRAHREIYRCLAPSGVYVFTVPYDGTMEGTRRLTLPSGNPAGPFFVELHVHGDPHSSSGIIAHRIYGSAFLREMTAIGYDIQFREMDIPRHGVFTGDIFLASRRA